MKFNKSELKLIIEALNALIDDDNEEYNQEIITLLKKINKKN
jgi:hypothetical protein